MKVRVRKRSSNLWEWHCFQCDRTWTNRLYRPLRRPASSARYFPFWATERRFEHPWTRCMQAAQRHLQRHRDWRQDFLDRRHGDALEYLETSLSVGAEDE